MRADRPPPPQTNADFMSCLLKACACHSAVARALANGNLGAWFRTLVLAKTQLARDVKAGGSDPSGPSSADFRFS
jgi:hypothetical protein